MGTPAQGEVNEIMPPRMRTRSAGWPVAESLGGETNVRVGRGRKGRRPREGNDERVDDLNGQGNDQGMGANGGAPDFSTIIAQQLQNLLPVMLAQVGNQGNVGNQNGNVVNENVGNVIVNGNRVGCSYKEFLACNPKEYDGKGGVVVLTRWIEKMEFMHDMSGCSIDQKVKNTAGSFVGKAIRQSLRYVIAGTLTDEALRNRTIKKNPEKRGNRGEPFKDRNRRDDNKRTRTRNAFATAANPVRGGYTGMAPKCTTCSYHHSLETPYRSCFNYNRPRYFARDCRVLPRNVNPINARNLVARTCYECGSIDHIKSAYPSLSQAQRLGGNHQNQVMAINEGSGS
ncbi:hypothetical protein Tco_1102981 [Tanacetum coccineum]